MAYTYKYTIDYIYDMDFYDFLQFYKRNNQRKENQAKLDLRRLQMITTAIHTGEPGNFIDELERVINNDPSKDIVGDLEALENLKMRREHQIKAGDMVAGE